MAATLATGMSDCMRCEGPRTRPVPSGELSETEQRLIGWAAVAGVELALTPGRGEPRRAGHRWLLGRDRREVAAASAAVSCDAAWLYPALLAIIPDDVEMRAGLRKRWVESVVGTGSDSATRVLG